MPLVDCQVEECASCLYHVYQGGYVAMHDTKLGRAEQKIFRNCVGELCMEGKPAKLNKVVHSTVYRMDELEDEEEEVEETVFGYEGED